MGKIKLIVTDLDGTFTGEGGVILDQNLKAVKAAQAKGIMVCACSARLWAMGRHMVEKCGFDRLAIFNGGATIVDCSTGEQIFRKGLAPENFRELLTATISLGAPVQSWNHDFIGLYGPTMGERGPSMIQRFTSTDSPMHCEMRVYDSLDGMVDGCKDVANQILIFSGNNALESVREKLSGFRDLEITCSSAHVVDVTGQGATKGNGVKMLAQHLGLTSENIMAIGDGLSDVDMFEFAGLKVAVENGVESIKNAAEHIVGKNTEGGFAQAVYELVLEG